MVTKKRKRLAYGESARKRPGFWREGSYSKVAGKFKKGEEG